MRGSLVSDLARIIPGTVYGRRFRVIAHLARGGMGEVYRGEDLRLDQPVALKFLPRERLSDQRWLERLRQEVRLAREVAHPNVCRVYDLVDTGDERFVAMEYVDGEDLAALLRRVGRLTPEHALRIAHQLTRALAAVHEKGIVHRDLKPANVMIDGRGQARLMDFGIALLSSDPTTEPEQGAGRAGTPAYMAPEQLDGEPPSSRSDVFSLGMVLLELFTGRYGIPAQGPDGKWANPPRLADLAPGLDGRVEGLILRCLERRPELRPASARAVAGALPGGDPLAAAISVGAIPDREVVAAAEDVEPMTPRRARVAAVVALLSLVLFGALAPQTSLVARLGEPLRPAELSARGREILGQAGLDLVGGQASEGFGVDWSYFHSVARRDGSARRWDVLDGRPSPLTYHWSWTRAARPLFEPRASAEVELDHAGRLVRLEAEPPLAAPGPGGSEWSPLFVEAGLVPEGARRVDVASGGPTGGRRLGWEVPFADSNGWARVDALTLDGRIASFAVRDQGSAEPGAGVAFQRRMSIGYTLNSVAVLLALLAAAGLALRNLRRGRGDREGAQRLAGAVLLTALAVRVLRGVPVLITGRRHVSAPALGEVLVLGVFAWVAYLAVEPYLRRLWPRALVGWARLLSGGFRDRLVGSDVLAGVCVGAVTCLLLAVIRLPGFGVVMLPLAPFVPRGPAMLSFGHLAAEALSYALDAVAFGLAALAGFVALKAVTRSEAVALVVALVGVLLPHAAFGVHHPVPFLIVHAAIFALPLSLLRHTGLLAFVFFHFSFSLLKNLVWSCDPGSWTGRLGLAPLLVLVSLVLWGLWRTTRAEADRAHDAKGVGAPS